MNWIVNKFNEVVPVIGGRISNDTWTYRDMTDFEEELLERVNELEERLEAEYEGGYMDGFKYVVDLIENFHKTEGEKLNLSFEEFVILESLLDYIKKCR